MTDKPENWSSLTPEQKRSIRLDAWVRGDGVSFANDAVKADYQKRAARFRTVLELGVPDRVPVAGQGGAFVYRRVGLPQKATFYERWSEAAEAVIKFQRDFEPDSAANSFMMPGAALELLDQSKMKWAGHGLPDDVQYQFVEQEFMKMDEYDHFLLDPSDFVLRRYLPRVYRALKGLGRLPQFSYDGVDVGERFIAPFMDPEVWGALELLKKAAELTVEPVKVMMATSARLAALGFPALSHGYGAAPFDQLGDSLRGTRGVLTDLYRCPNKVIAACEKILELTPIPDLPLGAPPMIMMPLHKGDDTHISLPQFEKFYWPTYKELLVRMIGEGLIPMPFAEGVYTKRLEYLTELPEKSLLWFFDRTDMRKAKDVLGGHSCIMGNVPITLIATGSPEQVKECCKGLIDYCGKGGGYILCSGTQLDDAREETVHALIDFTKEYGVYK